MAPHQNWRCAEIFPAAVVPRRTPPAPFVVTLAGALAPHPISRAVRCILASGRSRDRACPSPECCAPPPPPPPNRQTGAPKVKSGPQQQSRAGPRPSPHATVCPAATRTTRLPLRPPHTPTHTPFPRPPTALPWARGSTDRRPERRIARDRPVHSTRSALTKRRCKLD